MIGSSPIVDGEPVAGAGMRSARPTHSHSWAKIASCSNRSTSGDVYSAAGKADASSTDRTDVSRLSRSAWVSTRHHAPSFSRNLRILPTLVRGSSSTIDDGVGPLRLAEALGAPLRRARPQPVARRSMPLVARDDEGHRHLVADRIGPSDDGDVEHVGMLAEHLLDLDDRHVLARHLEHVGAAAVEAVAAVVVTPGAIAGAGTSRRRNDAPWCRVVEVAGEERDPRLAAHPDLSVDEAHGAAVGHVPHRVADAGRPRQSVRTAGIVSVMPYSWRGRHPNQSAQRRRTARRRGSGRTSSGAGAAPRRPVRRRGRGSSASARRTGWRTWRR